MKVTFPVEIFSYAEVGEVLKLSHLHKKCSLNMFPFEDIIINIFAALYIRVVQSNSIQHEPWVLLNSCLN